MKKEGFISTTLVYTFLILFLFLLLSILASYAQKNKFIDAIKEKIYEDLSIIDPDDSGDITIVDIYFKGKKVEKLDLTKNYTLEKYTCSNKEKVVWDDDEKSIKVLPMNKRTKCTLWFIPATLYAKIIENKGCKTNATVTSCEPQTDNIVKFNKRSSDTNGLGLYYTSRENMTEDYDGNGIADRVYYYRGDVKNNWVSFGGYLWRIIRTNEDGSVRMIYSGTTSNHTGKYTSIPTSENDYISSFAPVSEKLGRVNYNTATAVGYMYNPVYKLDTSPKHIIKAPGNNSTTILSSSMEYHDFKETTSLYFFNEFDLKTNCSLEDEKCSIELKCENSICNYVGSTWDALVNKVNGSGNPVSYTKDKTNYGSTDNYWYYINPYRYVCINETVKTNSVTGKKTMECPLVIEILGAVKDGTTASKTKARVRYHGIFSKSAEEAYKNVEDSKAKIELETWYASNIVGKTDSSNNLLTSYLEDEGFCNDRTYNSNSTGYNYDTVKNVTYSAADRNKTNKNPSLVCPNKNRDLFTVTSEKGNKLSKYPVGLITMDEMALGGIVFEDFTNPNEKIYLYTGQSYWTMSPSTLSSVYGTANEVRMRSLPNFNAHNVGGKLGLRPVINLKYAILYKGGNGTESNPYQIGLQ